MSPVAKEHGKYEMCKQSFSEALITWQSKEKIEDVVTCVCHKLQWDYGLDLWDSK
jgi:hypothetical protein